MAWSVKGTYFENCNCDVACPCNVSSLALPATNDRCHAFACFRIDEGEADGVDLSGRVTAAFIDAPGAMVEGGWSFGVVVDDGADEEQTRVLGEIFSGKVGGPLGAVAGLIGNDLGVESAPMAYTEDGRAHKITIGDDTSVEIEDFHAEGQPEATKLANVNIPFNTTLTLSVSKGTKINLFGYEVDNTGKSGASAPFAWSG